MTSHLLGYAGECYLGNRLRRLLLGEKPANLGVEWKLLVDFMEEVIKDVELKLD